jgi:hypothetical protein
MQDICEATPGYGVKQDAEPKELHCAGAICTEADFDACCERKDTCDSMMPGAADETCITYDACSYGLRADPWNIICSGSCTEAECCRQKTGEPVKPSMSNVVKDVLVYKTRVTGFSYDALAASPGLKNSLDAKFKPVFAKAGGVDVSQVTMEYNKGSLLVTAQIEAEEGQTLDHSSTTLPTGAEVLSAVKAVDGYEAALIPGEELEAADPIGVRYAAGGDSSPAEEITPPSPPPPPTPPTPPPTPAPTPTPPAKNEEEENNTTRTSSACLSAVAWQVLPLCVSSVIFSLCH